MNEKLIYEKINSVFKRDKETHKFIETEFSEAEFGYLWDSMWVPTEKIEGMNTRIIVENGQVRFGGRSDNATFPGTSLQVLQEMFKPEIFENINFDNVVIVGELIGPKIQGNYYKLPDYKFVGFDVYSISSGRYLDGNTINRSILYYLAQQFTFDIAWNYGSMSLETAYNLIKSGPKLTSFVNHEIQIEGFVLRPEIELRGQYGQRIITKVKYCDFE